jgi:hypothetical protein
MTWSDAMKIIFGAAIGLLISLCQGWVAFKRAQKRSEKLLRVLIPRLSLTMESLKTVYIDHQWINTTELPSLNYFGSAELAALPDNLAVLVIDLDDSIRRAEMSRKIATINFANQGSREFIVHQQAYGEYIQGAVSKLETIQKYMQSQQSASVQNSPWRIHRWLWQCLGKRPGARIGR